MQCHEYCYASYATMPVNVTMPANATMPENAAMPANTAMPMFLTSCETEMFIRKYG